MLYKDLGLKKSRTYSLMKNTAPYIKSSIKLDSFLNFSKLSNDSKFSLNSDYKIKKEEKKKKKKSKNLYIIFKIKIKYFYYFKLNLKLLTSLIFHSFS